MAYTVCFRNTDHGCTYTCANKSSAETLRLALQRTHGDGMKLVKVSGRAALPARMCREMGRRIGRMKGQTGPSGGTGDKRSAKRR